MGFKLKVRIISFMPPRHEMVDVFEAALVLLLHYLGVCLLNDSPPCAPDGSRFFEHVAQRPPQLQRCVVRWVASMSGAVSARRSLVCNVKPPWLRRALEAADIMLSNGTFVLPGGARVLPELALRTRAGGAQNVYSAMQCAEALLAGDAQLVVLVAAWCRGCSCQSRMRLCACIALVDARNRALRRARQVLSFVLALLSPSEELVLATEAAAAGACVGAGAAAAASPLVASFADVVGDAALAAVSAPLLIAGLAAEGSSELRKALQRFSAATANLFSVAWSEGAATSRGGAIDRKRRRSTTAAAIERESARAGESAIVAAQPLTAEGRLLHLLRRHTGGIAVARAGEHEIDALGATAEWDGGRLTRSIVDMMHSHQERTVNQERTVTVALERGGSEPAAAAAALGADDIACAVEASSSSAAARLPSHDLISTTRLSDVAALSRKAAADDTSRVAALQAALQAYLCARDADSRIRQACPRAPRRT